MKKIKFNQLAILVIIGLAFYTASCSSSDEEASCTDGILNQGEEAIDCGGPCSACPVLLCDGNGESTFMPLKVSYNWKYKSTLFSSTINYSCTTTDTINDVVYFVIRGSDLTGWSDDNYYRKAANGDIFVLKEPSEEEVLLIPTNPLAGFEWDDTNSTGESYKVAATDATYENDNCNYTGLLKIEEYLVGTLTKVYYYKRGLGLVNYETIGILNYDTYLKEVIFN